MKPKPKPKSKAKSKATPDAKPKRILLVEDHPLMREGVAQWIDRSTDLKVCGEAESAAQALSAVAKLKPDLVLTDISLTGRNGLELIKDLTVLHPGIPSMVLSMHDESLYAGRALRAGARGYVMKRAGGARVVEAIREVLHGRVAVSPEMSTHLLTEMASNRATSNRATSNRATSNRATSNRVELSRLTDREFEIFQLIGAAKSNREIAQDLHISPKTVETHRLNLMGKLNLKNRSELLRFALQYVEKEAAGAWPG